MKLGIVEYQGWGKVRELSKALNILGSRNVMLVVGSTSYVASGAKPIVDVLLSPYNVNRFIVSSSLPNIGTIAEGVSIARSSGADVVVGIGGGNVLDTAKCIAVLSTQLIDDYKSLITKKIPLIGKSLPKILIPTTAGTGSEATQFAVIYMEKQKYSLDNKIVFPEFAIIDPGLTSSLNPYITACTGIDALAQAIEAFWSVRSTDESNRYSSDAITSILPVLYEVVNNPYAKHREVMTCGSNLAGKAINIARTTTPHSVSYPISAHFGVQHGHAVALTLPSIFDYNGAVEEDTVQDKRGISYVLDTMGELCLMFDTTDCLYVKHKLECLLDLIGLERRLSKLGVTESGVDIVLNEGFNPERVINNPRVLTRDALEVMLRKIY